MELALLLHGIYSLLQLVYCIEAYPNRGSLGTEEVLEMVLGFVGSRFGAALVRALLVDSKPLSFWKWQMIAIAEKRTRYVTAGELPLVLCLFFALCGGSLRRSKVD